MLNFKMKMVVLLGLLWPVLLCPVMVVAEPELPTGLEDDPALPEGISTSNEPSIPVGLEGEESSEADWSFDEGMGETSKGIAGITGFWEARLGQRLYHDRNQRDASLSETRLELEKEWQLPKSITAKLTVDLLYDAIEETHRNDVETGAGWMDLREAWVQHRFAGNVDIKAGRQILTWGVGDLIFINDLFPKDWNSFLAGRDEQYLKSPSDALRLGFYSELVNINLIYVPRFDSDRFIDGRRLSYFSPLIGEIVGQNGILTVDKPDNTGDDNEWALRIYRQVGSYELALYGYDGFWKSPAGFDPNTGLALFPRLAVIGASSRGPLGLGIFSAEVGYYKSKDDNNGGNAFINNSEFRALAGYEWEVARDTTLGLQYYLEVMDEYHNYRDNLPVGQPVRDHYRQLLTVRLTRLALGQNLSMGLFVFYSPTDEDVYLRPKVHYKINDNWSVESGLNLFSGKQDDSFFGQFEDNTNIYGGIRFSF